MEVANSALSSAIFSGILLPFIICALIEEGEMADIGMSDMFFMFHGIIQNDIIISSFIQSNRNQQARLAAVWWFGKLPFTRKKEWINPPPLHPVFVYVLL